MERYFLHMRFLPVFDSNLKVLEKPELSPLQKLKLLKEGWTYFLAQVRSVLQVGT